MHPQVRRGVAGARATSRRPARSRAAYTDSFLLNVYPYGTVFTDSSGELNAPGAWMAAERFEARGYRAQDLSEAGAPDHLDLFLGFLDHLSGDARKETELFSDFTRWAPVCCLAVERETSAHPCTAPSRLLAPV